MTRETKIGLVVAGSFLCLVCVVVASKMNGAGDSYEPAEPPLKPVTNPVAALTPPSAKGEHQQPSPPAPAAPKNVGAVQPAAVPSNPPAPPLNAVPTAVKTTEQIHKELTEAVQRQKKDVIDLPMVAPPPAGASATLDPAIPMVGPDGKVTLPASVPPLGANVPGPVVAAPSGFGAGDPVPAPPLLPQSKPVEAALPIPVVPQVGGLNPAKSVEPLPAPANPSLKDSVPFAKDVSLPPVPKENQAPFGSAPDPLAPLPAPMPMPPIGVNAPNPPPAAPPPSINPPVPLTSPPTSLNPTGPVPVPAPAPLVPPPSLPQTSAPPGPIPTISSTQSPSTPPIHLTPPNVGTPIPTVPPIAAAGVGPLPQVRSTSPESAKVQPGETNFTDLSKRLYNDEKYARALQAFNKKYRDGLANGQVFDNDAPILTPGQQVWHPQIGLLERDFPTLIGSGAPSPVMPVISTAPAVRAIPVVPSSAPVTTTPAGAGTYIVQTAGGERIRDIALRVLGNADRWTDIYRLNPSLQPQFAIPQGTRLQLP
jgi:hypothetical protein